MQALDPTIEAELRAGSPDAWTATLFAPPDLRPALQALHAFAAEVAGMRGRVSQPLPGEIRLQWWREALSGGRAGEAAGHPVARLLIDAIGRFHLPPAAFEALIEAHIFDLYDDPMPGLPDLEGYCGETHSAVVRLATLILARGEDPGAADLAGHAGVALGIAAILRGFPVTARRGQCYLPADLLAARGTSPAAVTSGRDGEKVLAAQVELARAGLRHAAAVRAGQGAIPAAVGPAFLPLAAARLDLERIARGRHAPYGQMPVAPRWRRIVALWRASRRRGV